MNTDTEILPDEIFNDCRVCGSEDVGFMLEPGTEDMWETIGGFEVTANYVCPACGTWAVYHTELKFTDWEVFEFPEAD